MRGEWLGALALSATLSLPTAAAAADDGVYGRFSGDLDFGLGLGAEAERGSLRAAAAGSVHAFDMAGLAVRYGDALGADADERRLLALGVDLRPAFIPRWTKGRELGPATLDLVIDSFALGVSAWFATPRGGDFGDRRGIEASLGFGVPLVGDASGPWLELSGRVRWPDLRGAAEAGPVLSGVLLLSWHALTLSPWATADAESGREAY